MSRTVDAHQHFWRTAAQKQPWRTGAHATLEADFGPDDLEIALRAAGIDATILVQSVNEPAENDRLADYAKSPFVAGVVAWLPLTDPGAALAELDRMNPLKACGVRTLIAQDPLRWLAGEESLRLFREIARRGLVWDVVPVTTEQIRAVLALADALPELRIVVDHLGGPPVDTGACQPWASHLGELATRPNVAVKVSVGIDVLTSWDSWQGRDLFPYVEWVAEHFGAARLMMASNWPVILLKADYQLVWQDLLSTVQEVFPAEEDQDLLKGRAAEEWYGLSVPVAPGSSGD